jgi:hypothetical protein
MTATAHDTAPLDPYPVHVDAVDEPRVSRWLWLVKWLLAIPHYVVLAFLWAAFVVLSVVALFAILFTGRYPRPIFDFNVGVLRWWWRVSYYSYGALATDRYPPFTLAEDPSYPAHLEIEYPEQLSRGLALVKWWLLAIPHYLVVGILVGSGATVAWQDDGDARWTSGVSLVGLLALVAAVMVAATGAYPRPIYDLLLGLNRWVLRVAAYAGLMTDQYPPFRLDQGPHEPDGRMDIRSGDVTAPPLTPLGTTPSASAGTTAAPPDPRQYAAPTPTSGPQRRTGWGAGSVATVIGGCLAALLSLGLLSGGVTVLVADSVARDSNGYIMSGVERVDSDGHAVLFDRLQIDTATADWVPQRLIGDVKVTISPVDPATPVFFGIGDEQDVARYLRGAPHSVERGPGLGPRDVTGTATPAPPATVGIWDASTTGSGDQELVWVPRDGEWSAVVMNSDASAGVSADVAVGATLPWMVGLGVSLLAMGLAIAAISALMITLAMRHVSRHARI